MSLIKTILVNGVDWTGKLSNIVIKHTKDTSWLEADYRGYAEDFNFTPCRVPPIIVYDVDDNIVFVGRMKYPDPSNFLNPTKSKADFKVVANSYKNYYKNIPVAKKFTSATVSEMFTQMIQEYTSDEVGTIIEYNDIFEMTFTTNLSEALIKIADAVMDNEGAMWTITYNEETGKAVHNLVWQFNNTLAQLEHIEGSSAKPFIANERDVYNIYVVNAKNVLFLEDLKMSYYFLDPLNYRPVAIYNEEQGIIKLMAPGNIINARLFLVVGEPSSDLASRWDASNIIEIPIPIIGMDAASQAAITVDPELFLTGKLKSLMPETLQTGNDITVSLSQLQAQFTKNPIEGIPESENGYFTVWDRNWLWNYLRTGWDGRAITPDDILGYRIYYNRKEDIRQQYPADISTDESVLMWGPKKAPDIDLDDLPDARWLEAYIARLLATTRWAKVSGAVTVLLEENGVRKYSAYPMPGDKADILMPNNEVIENTYINEVEYRFGKNITTVYVNTAQVPSGWKPFLEIERYKRAIASLKNQTAVTYSAVLKVNDTMPIVEKSCKLTTITNMNMTWGFRDHMEYAWQG